VTNQAGSVVETTTYDPWGEIVSGGTANKFLYTGQEHDGETGLHYYNARYYNPDIRRFTQPDDIIQNIYDPQMLNRYSYVRNNPIKYTDPSGHFINPFTILSAINTISDIFSAAKSQSSPQKSNNNLGAHKPTSGGSAPLNKVLGSNSSSGSDGRPQTPPGVSIKQNVSDAQAHKVNLSIFNLNNPVAQTKNTYNTLWFINKVNYGGDWDYKKYDNNKYQDYGNWHYGVVGSAAGYPGPILQVGAGVAQQIYNLKETAAQRPYNVQPTSPLEFFDAVESNGFSRDQYRIKQGIGDFYSNSYY
jgi:RHS repeat-associated protein